MYKYPKSFTLVVFASFLLSRVDAQIYFTDAPPYEDSVLIQPIFNGAVRIQDSLVALGYSVKSLEIFETDSRKVMVIDGRLNYFVWVNQCWVNCSKSKYHGYNFMSKKFAYNGTIYSIGGYGFWREHGDLIKYDTSRNEWESIPLHTEEDPGNGLCFKVNDILYVFNPLYRNQHIDLARQKQGLCKIDLLSHDITFSEMNEPLFKLKAGVRIETNNYYLPSRDPFQIIDKRNMKFKTSEITYLLDLSKYDSQSFFWIRGDSVTLITNDSTRQSFLFDFDEIYKKAPFKEISILKSGLSSRLGWGTVLLMAIFLFLWIRFRKVNDSPNFGNPSISKLLVFSGNTLTQEELDVILEIDKIIPAETQRAKRSAAFNEINHEFVKVTGRDLIARIPDPRDKRKFLYKISEM